MLRTRVLTGLVLASIALLALSFLPTIAIVGITAVVGFLGALEWADLRRQAPSTAFCRGYALVVAIGVVVLWRFFEHSVVAKHLVESRERYDIVSKTRLRTGHDLLAKGIHTPVYVPIFHP